ncbi:MAG TPA: hypothetical protein VIM38_03920 [Alphaproteobacteria bacterium]
MADSGRTSTSRLEQAFTRLDRAIKRLESAPAPARLATRSDGEAAALRARCAELTDGARIASHRLDHAIERIRALIAE